MAQNPPPSRRPGSGSGKDSSDRPAGKISALPPDQPWRWALAALGVLVVAALLFPGVFGEAKQERLDYSDLINRAAAEPTQVGSATISNTTGEITGELSDGTAYEVDGPVPPLEQDVKLLRDRGVETTFVTPQPGLLAAVVPWLIMIGLLLLFYMWMSRKAQGQMSGLMSIGRSRAKVYTTERPKTKFEDVAGYIGVKQEIREVVDFLKSPGVFEKIGARIPKGVLLVGPPGTGKTLLARAVAGEAGVPFLSVTGSDFMEMFVGVGASRVRDLFQTARKQAPAIIFVDEIDSIGRKRGAGLGGGHDEREQTLNQMLSEMDGFETTEGIVMMAATNRPDILDPALLRPGRFDRQIVVPLPDLDERLPILQVHCKDKKMGDDVDLALVARGTPGMSGADLANLVNEAALHAVRRGVDQVHMEDFEAARDRVIMGQRRESMALSDSEKEVIAYHEGGHAVLGYVLPSADPVHKVTILPTGMALGVTQQLPMEERHIYRRDYIEDSLAVRLGGRIAEELVFDMLSTGANNDLVGCTELARKMVREWGMSDRVGPMAWGSQGAVFLGDDLMHSRDYSDETSRVIDEEVGQILRGQEDRAREVLGKHRKGLDAVAAALLEFETIDGAEVGRLVDEAFGKPVHEVGHDKHRGGGVPKLGRDAERHGGPETDGPVPPVPPVDVAPTPAPPVAVPPPPPLAPPAADQTQAIPEPTRNPDETQPIHGS